MLSDSVCLTSDVRLTSVCLSSVAYIRSVGDECNRPAGWRVLADRARLGWPGSKLPLRASVAGLGGGISWRPPAYSLLWHAYDERCGSAHAEPVVGSQSRRGPRSRKHGGRLSYLPVMSWIITKYDSTSIRQPFDCFSYVTGSSRSQWRNTSAAVADLYLCLSSAARHTPVMWSETVGLRTGPVWDSKIGLGLAVLVLFCETRSCHDRRLSLEGHSNFWSTI